MICIDQLATVLTQVYPDNFGHNIFYAAASSPSKKGVPQPCQAGRGP